MDRIASMIEQSVHKVDAQANVILYGSRARGDERPDSDWDVVIIVDRPQVDFQTFMQIGNPLYDIAVENNVEINPLIYTKDQWQNSPPSMFRHNVIKEGVVL